jgi:hypothetical protein
MKISSKLLLRFDELYILNKKSIMLILLTKNVICSNFRIIYLIVHYNY